MGYCSSHQAIPVNSDLYRLLASDEEANPLLEAFWKSGGFPLDLWEAGEGEVEETMAWYAENQDREIALVRRDFDRLEAAIERTESANLGLKERTAYLEKTHRAIQTWIESRCEAIGWADGSRFAEQLLFGNGRLGSFGHLDMPLVERAARFFQNPDALVLTEDEEVEFGDDLRLLADLRVVAVECNEILLMSGG